MFIQSSFKNRNYIISKRNYLSDYSKIESKKIDMTLSGKYLAAYPKHEPIDVLFDTYPSHETQNEFERLLRKEYGIKDRIILGSGSNGLLQNIVKLFFVDKGNLVVPYYVFNQVEYAVTSFGGYTKRVFSKNYDVDFEKLYKSIDKKTRMVYITNPCNPTGLYIEPNKILEFAKKIKIPVIIDESSIEFACSNSILDVVDHLPDNLIIVRSFSKAFGLANLRIGYLICSKKVEQLYIKNITTNEYSDVSSRMAIICIQNIKFMKKNIEKINAEKEYLDSELRKIGINCLQSFSNTLFTKTIFDISFIDKLSENDISVVSVYDKDKNLHIRIAVQDRKTNDLFLKKVKQILKNSNLIKGEYID